ncbi:hypothetical protein SAMN02745823_03877 [Sporobacter termitidis DSM 10068]|uniref:Uncharacterized protein n=1 Tax=Sporobacter termitidis DSM 10068 TaxID=1123282 RepID=A0A1M5ZKY7_9FIRM|nr:hypothetical protein [Sporobacter termitidis]SHI24822.1 hypothetical protein SAMN02745823_03871 [Sporobacter termitidis DSM 10068]SHI24885.1 hypothetical protein SAMN02745823_03877 [Sporobacter termitidis DSM 10068]
MNENHVLSNAISKLTILCIEDGEEKEIAAITNELITTACPSVVVKLSPKID